MNKKFSTVTVIGANGSMGVNISGIFAAFGDTKVFLVCRNIEKATASVEKVCKSVRADSISNKLIPADYSMLDECIAQSDIVIESIVENLDDKIDITKKIALSLRKDAIACSGTSGLSITALAEYLPEHLRGNYLGVHMFNPPYNMSLCEVIPTKYTNNSILETMKEYLSTVLFRTVVVVKDSPAFLGNRIGFQFINEVMQLADKYKEKGGIDFIDSIFAGFTGRAMAPLNTSDFVGLDVHKAIVDNIYENTADYARDTFKLPHFAQKLVAEGKLGRKVGVGLYKLDITPSGSKRILVYDIILDEYRERKKYDFPFTSIMNEYIRNGEYEKAFNKLVKDDSFESNICLTLLLKYIIYSLNTSLAVSFDVSAADDVMATGFNWCPPLALAEAFSKVTDLDTLVKTKLSESFLSKIDIDSLLKKLKPSKYDYRPYFKAAR